MHTEFESLMKITKIKENIMIFILLRNIMMVKKVIIRKRKRLAKKDHTVKETQLKLKVKETIKESTVIKNPLKKQR